MAVAGVPARADHPVAAAHRRCRISTTRSHSSGLPLAVILAGGLGRRLGSVDKAQVELGGRPLVEHVIGRLAGQADRIVINANGDETRFARWGLPVIPDSVPDRPGPLAGILAALEWSERHAPQIRDVMSVPCDGPFLPTDLAARLREARDQAGTELAFAAYRDELYPVVGLWPIALAADLRRAIVEDGVRAVRRWSSAYKTAIAPFDEFDANPFLNANTPADLAEAASRFAPI